MEWGPTEVSATVDLMVASVQTYFETSKERPFIELNKIQNKTSEHINTNMLANEIATSLIKRKIVFVDRSQRADAIKEMELSQRGNGERKLCYSHWRIYFAQLQVKRRNNG
jgi:PBP1b-binding outer membrane lipoprotein LpoB